MKTSATDQPLTDDDVARLADFLDGIEPAGMNLEMLDGYFCALICGPDMVMPSEYLPNIWGEDFSFDNDDEAMEIIGLLIRHWNTVSGELRRTLDEPHAYMPVLLEDEAGIARGNDWAQGFLRGVQMRPDGWAELIGNEEHGGPMLIIMLLAHENDPDPRMRPPPVPDDKREELLVGLAASTTQIYRFFAPRRRSLSGVPLHVTRRRDRPKIGRNDPCPCGSGQKYKHCCAAGARALH